MSYILEALRKADREREMARARPADLAPAQTPPPRPRALWPWIAVAVVLVNAGVIALVVQNMPGARPRFESRTQEAPRGAPGPSDGPGATVSAPATAPVVSPAGPSASPPPAEHAVAAGASSAEPPRPPAPPVAPIRGANGRGAAQAGATPSASKRDREAAPTLAAAASPGPHQSTPATTSPSGAAEEPVVATDPAGPGRSAPAGLPAAPEMPAPGPRVTEPGRLDHTAGRVAEQRGKSRPGASARTGAKAKGEPAPAAASAGASPGPPAEAAHSEPAPGQPDGAPTPSAPAATDRAVAARGPGSLRLDVHVYSERPAERMVFINNKKYVEGQQVEDRLRLEEITPEGAVLSADGQRILLGR